MCESCLVTRGSIELHGCSHCVVIACVICSNASLVLTNGCCRLIARYLHAVWLLARRMVARICCLHAAWSLACVNCTLLASYPHVLISSCRQIVLHGCALWPARRYIALVLTKVCRRFALHGFYSQGSSSLVSAGGVVILPYLLCRTVFIYCNLSHGCPF